MGLGHGLPDEVLLEVLNFSGLREFGACAAAGSKLRGGLERLSPAIGHQLVLRKYPILALMFEGAETTELPPPRELFESQARILRPTPTSYVPTRGSEKYTFLLEVKLLHRERGTGKLTYAETLWAGKTLGFGNGGSMSNEASHPRIEFDLPNGVFERCNDAWFDAKGPAGPWSNGMEIQVDVMAVRRSSEGLQRALLGSGQPNEGHPHCDPVFWDLSHPLHYDWLQQKAVGAQSYYLPGLRAAWMLYHDEVPAHIYGLSNFIFYFMWADPNDENDMNVEDACLALEHYYTWV